VEVFPGKKVICGGTTANIIARQLGRKLSLDSNQPALLRSAPTSSMEGIDLVTKESSPSAGGPAAGKRCSREEIVSSPALTSGHETAEERHHPRAGRDHKSTVLQQDPNVPVDLEIRRNISVRSWTCWKTRSQGNHLQFISPPFYCLP
jgi:hypothetical protein